jgi:hypothetical protein
MTSPFAPPRVNAPFPDAGVAVRSDDEVEAAVPVDVPTVATLRPKESGEPSPSAQSGRSTDCPPKYKYALPVELPFPYAPIAMSE